jgi:hypothetical protein
MSAKRPDKRSLISRVLGPSGPELGCEACFELLDRYVELELAGEPADELFPRMRPHLEGCPACREEHESLRALLAEEARAGGSQE